MKLMRGRSNSEWFVFSNFAIRDLSHCGASLRALSHVKLYNDIVLILYEAKGTLNRQVGSCKRKISSEDASFESLKSIFLRLKTSSRVLQSPKG